MFSIVKVLVAQSCPTLCNSMVCSLPGSSVHGFSRQENGSGLPFPSPFSIVTAPIACPSPGQGVSFSLHQDHFPFPFFLLALLTAVR